MVLLLHYCTTSWLPDMEARVILTFCASPCKWHLFPIFVFHNTFLFGNKKGLKQRFSQQVLGYMASLQIFCNINKHRATGPWYFFGFFFFFLLFLDAKHQRLFPENKIFLKLSHVLQKYNRLFNISISKT